MLLKSINKILAGLVFLLSLIVYTLTMAPTTSLWDCGEFIATAYTLGVGHPPGAPLYLLLGNVMSNIPIFDNTFNISRSKQAHVITIKTLLFLILSKAPLLFCIQS